MRINEIITLVEENKPTNIPFADGHLWVGDHFSQRSDTRGGMDALKAAVRLVAGANQSSIKDLIIAIPVENKETFALYDPTYFGVSVIKKK
jgi:hypothetical protein